MKEEIENIMFSFRNDNVVVDEATDQILALFKQEIIKKLPIDMFLDKEERELYKKINGRPTPPEDDFCLGFNHCLSEIKKLIESL